MNLGALIFGFVAIALLAGMFIFIGATQSITVVDSYGNTSTAAGNATDMVVTNVTAVGSAGTGYLVLVLAALGLIAGVAVLVAYGRTK